MMNKANWKRLLFMHIPDDDVGFFIFPRYYYIALAFFTARYETKTWEKFWSSLDSECREFLEPFMQCDDVKPRPDSCIADLDDLFIFSDSEFPMTQFAEETYTEITSYLPLDLLEVELRTEYHYFIGLFPIKHFELLNTHLDQAGFKVDKVASLVPVDLRSY